MATALTHKITPDFLIPGVVLEGFALPQRDNHQKTTKFWGVNGESRIFGQTGGRDLIVPAIIYDDSGSPLFATQAELSIYLNTTLNETHVGKTGALKIHSQSDHADFPECTFDGLVVLPGGIKIDYAGSLGGGPFAICRFRFRQHT